MHPPTRTRARLQHSTEKGFERGTVKDDCVFFIIGCFLLNWAEEEKKINIRVFTASLYLRVSVVVCECGGVSI